jgi:Rrf2 family protein
VTPSKKLLLAIEAVLDIAYNAGGQPVQSREITERQGIPQRYLEPVLQQLVRAGILVGVRGPRGGYRLARERRRISVGDVTRVVQQEESPEDALDQVKSDLGRAAVCPLWRDVAGEVMTRLDAVSIDDLCVRARDAGVESRAAERLDFTI